MMHSERLLRRPAIFRRLTGLKPGAGPRPSLPVADQLLVLLFYYRTYVSHAFLGVLFSVDQGTVSRYVAALEPLLAGIFRIPERRAELREDEVRELFFDGTERPTRRPERKQRRYYSGKKRPVLCATGFKAASN